MTGNFKKSEESFLDQQASYFVYKLSVSKKYIRIFIIAACLINLVMLIPDLALIKGEIMKISIAVIRVIFSLVLLGVFLKIKNIKTFGMFSLVVTGCELFAIAIFLFVLFRYNQPNFPIQTMGLIILIIAVFYAPNRWKHKLFTAVLGSVGFFICALVFPEFVNTTDFWASIVYVSVAVILCAISAKNTEKHQFREYLARCELEHISSTDYLTNTANRYKMKEEAERWMDFCRRQELPLSLVFIDVDDLKIVNDKYGHPVGDSVLADLAKMIKNQLRSSDILARWGGDEFVVLLPNVTLEPAIALIERIRNSIRENTFVKGISVTCSFGIVEMKEDSKFETLIKQADKLMYISKKHGKDNIQWTDKEKDPSKQA